jgi:ligand-binding SRPBCC domain-containing protein
MPARWTLRSSLWLQRPPHEVFPFFADAFNLEQITPPFLRFEVRTQPPIAMHVGTLIDYRLRIHGLPVSWRTHIAEWQPPHCFADEQLRGPYSKWYHRHMFVAHAGGTLARDEVAMTPRGGLLAPLVMRLFVERDVRAIFAYRAEFLCRRFGGDPRSQQLEIVRDKAAQ